MASQSLVGLILVAVSVFTPAFLPFSKLPVASAATNRLVKASTPAVYYVAEDNKRYVFPNQRVYESWYRDFTSVQTVSDAELASYPIGGTVFYRPGTRLVKIASDPKVYAVAPQGLLHPIADETAAIRLFGATWAQRVDDLSDAFFANYQVGGALDGSTHPIDTFFRYTDNNSYYVLDYLSGNTVARQISDTYINAYGLRKPNALSLRSVDFPYDIGPNIGDADATRFYTVRFDTALNPSTPSDPSTPTSPTNPNTPPAATATLSFSRWSSLPTTQKLVDGDDYARLFAFTIDGDASQTLTISKLSLRLYIDAGGNNNDFSPGFDSDDPVAWSVGQLISSFALRDLESGQIYDTELVVDSQGMVTFTPNLPIPAKVKKTLELTGRVQTVFAGVRISADIIPSTDVVLQNGSSTVSIKPSTSLNGGVSPSSTVYLVDYGSLSIASTNPIGDSLQPLISSVVPYKLTFTANGEPFTVSSLSIGLALDGDDIYAVDRLSLTYTREDGVVDTIAHSFVDTENNIFRFINLRLYVPKGATITVPVTLLPKTDATLYSGSRVQIKLISDSFSATSHFSDLEYTENFLGDTNRLEIKATNGPLLLLRQGTVQIQGSTETPSGTITRYNKLPVLSFQVSAKERAISIHRLTFKVETTDIDEDGDDNDYFERVADRIANTVVGMATHHLDIDERGLIHPQVVTFKFYDASAGQLIDDARGIQTDVGDYGIFVLDFGSSPITVSAGTTNTFDFDLDTTLFSPDDGVSVRVRMLGDSKTTAVSQAHFTWSDGSNIQTTGYLVSGLELQGGYLSIR